MSAETPPPVSVRKLKKGSIACKARGCWIRSPRYRVDKIGRTRCIRCGSNNVAEVLEEVAP